METDSPDLVVAKRLLDHAKLCGFEFRRVAPGEDGPLVGHRSPMTGETKSTSMDSAAAASPSESGCPR